MSKSEHFDINLSYSFENVGVSKALLYTHTGVFSHMSRLRGHVLSSIDICLTFLLAYAVFALIKLGTLCNSL